MSFTTKITLSISLLGILILLILTNILLYPQITIKDITSNHLNKKLSTSGTITKIQNHKEFQIITITQNSFSIDILLDQKINLTRNQKIQIKGRLEKYKDN
jgi:aspartyl/asparaginyl-tRNA synthetase